MSIDWGIYNQEPMNRPKGGEGASKYVYHVLLIMRAWMTIKGNL